MADGDYERRTCGTGARAMELKRFQRELEARRAAAAAQPSSPRLYDTHAHFEDADDVAAVFERAAAAGVVKILAVGGSEDLNRNALRTPGRVALGWDRDQSARLADPSAAVADLRALVAVHAPRLAAIGEIGLDCHYDPETLPSQTRLFAAQLELAAALALPVVVHTREADDATLGVLDEIPASGSRRLRGVIHSFTGTPAFARRLMDRGFAISFSGIATFRAADNVRESVRYVPDDLILVETDSPFLAPVPMRGQRCEPAFTVHTARRIAEERGTPFADFAARTFANSEALFG